MTRARSGVRGELDLGSTMRHGALAQLGERRNSHASRLFSRDSSTFDRRQLLYLVDQRRRPGLPEERNGFVELGVGLGAVSVPGEALSTAKARKRLEK